MEKYILTRDEFISQANILVHQIKAQAKTYDLILCITKWWMHLSYHLADKLGIKDIRTFCCASYLDNNQQSDLHIIYEPMIEIGKRVLIVDDLIDSGKTLNIITAKYPTADVAVLLIKSWHHFAAQENTVLYCAQDHLPHDQWIDFYYETN